MTLGNRSPESGSYHLSVWGAGAQAQGIEGDFWFPSNDERLFFLMAARSVEPMPIAAVSHDGEQASYRTVCHILFEFDGKHYPIEFDFGVGYEEEAAHYMFEEGNYACDCNRSLIIHREFPEFEETDCGEEIEIVSFVVERKSVFEVGGR